MTHDTDEMTHALQSAGYRLTKPRLAVLQVLRDNEEHLSPEAIHALGRDIYPPLGLVTVYRTLDVLIELGLVKRVHSEDRCHSYARAGEHRHYLVCQGCQRVIEFPCDGLEQVINVVRDQTGFDINSHLLELGGLCPQCQQLSQERKDKLQYKEAPTQ